MRVLGVDYGRRRIGLGLSDASATLARPWQVVASGQTPRASAAVIAAIVATQNADELSDPIAQIVVGLPRRLGGEDNDQTPLVRAFSTALAAATGLPVALQDERLTSRAAEEQLAVRERDWRKRKKLIDATAAAIILQDFLDARAGQRGQY